MEEIVMFVNKATEERLRLVAETESATVTIGVTYTDHYGDFLTEIATERGLFIILFPTWEVVKEFFTACSNHNLSSFDENARKVYDELYRSKNSRYYLQWKGRQEPPPSTAPVYLISESGKLKQITKAEFVKLFKEL